MTEPKNPVQAVEKSIKIICTLHELDGATLTELTNHLDFTKGAVHHHLSTLKSHGLVVNNGGEYQLGIRFFELGEDVRNKKQIYQIGMPEVDKLAEETGELANILIEEHGRGTYLYRSQGEEALSLDTGVGSRVYLHNTGLGKAILAHLSEERVHEILDRHGMPATTRHTITDRDELFDELAMIREQGYAPDMEERAEGIRCVAAPVITKDDVVQGAVSIAGPRGRMNGEYLNETVPDLVTNAADVISINLSYA